MQQAKNIGERLKEESAGDAKASSSISEFEISSMGKSGVAGHFAYCSKTDSTRGAMAIKSAPWHPITAHIEALYGVGGRAFGNFGFWSVDGEIWISPAGFHHPDTLTDLQNWGWPVLTALPPEGEATGDLLKMIGADAKRNVVQVSDAQADLFAQGHLDPELWADADHTAPALAVCKGHLALGGVIAETGQALPAQWFG